MGLIFHWNNASRGSMYGNLQIGLICDDRLDSSVAFILKIIIFGLMAAENHVLKST